MTDNEKQKPSGQFGVDKASGADKSVTHQLTIDELPKHTNSLDIQGTGNYLPAQYGQVKAEPKHWYQSKTIWFNLIVTAATLASSATPALEQHMSAEVYGVIASGVSFVNAILRLVTGKPIKGGGNG
ncbi:hypothetical protein ACTXJ2_08370 [Psychrobacter alimentarius]|uniref:hypothetical protein n=1 Tax=Psychrobacter alimentarius TaxID=261164 RepID=UPI003FD18DC5